MFYLSLLILYSVTALAVGEGNCSINNSCPDASGRPQFCNFDFGQEEGGFCEPCVDHPGACSSLGLQDAGTQNCADVCAIPKDCSDSDPCNTEYGEYFCNYDYGDEGGFCEYCGSLELGEECNDLGLPDRGAESCISSCDLRVLCSASEPCPEGTYCDHAFGDTGYCEGCGDHVHECSNLDQPLAVDDCARSCNLDCFDSFSSEFTVSGTYFLSEGFDGSPPISASGPLVDCRDNGGERKACAPHFNATGGVCLIENVGKEYFWKKLLSCEQSGGVAAIIYNYENEIFRGTLITDSNPDGSNIPAVMISLEDGMELLENSMGETASISIIDDGVQCYTECSKSLPSIPCSDSSFCFYYNREDHGWCEKPDDGFCSTSHPCPASSFCNFDYEDQGFCEPCENYDDVCYFSGLPLPGARDCAEICESSVITPECKFCPKDLSLESLGTAKDSDSACEFCPSGLKEEFYDRQVGLFEGINCFLVDEFFRNYQIAESDENCQLAQVMNYKCECDGPGYAGANTKAKRAALAWLPRMMAIMSLVGSAYIILDVMYLNKRRRKKLFGQLMVTLSTFDLFGSTAYALTTIPLPKEDFIYGSHGNEATCKAQGFFIQVGTISAYLNVSLSVYYFCTINLAWTESKMMKVRPWLFACPIIIGFALAFAGIPFYGNAILWCNNSADYWPDIPVAIAIFLVTVIMSNVCWHVHKQEKASKRWRQRGDAPQNSLTTKVFWQSFWYLMAFYMTWPPYLALQYLWASGRAYSMYGFILYAGTVVPLQGFWNFFVYVRPRTNFSAAKFVSSLMASSLPSRFSSLRKSNATTLHTSNVKSGSSENPGTAINTGVIVSNNNGGDDFGDNK